MSKQQSKKERREAARQRRIEEMRRRQRRKRRNQIILGAAALIAISVIAGFVIRNRVVVANQASSAGCSDVRNVTIQDAAPHLEEGETFEYNSNPPTSGRHLGSTAPWGVSDEKIDDRIIVHNLEHGGIVIHHNGLSDEGIDSLEEIADGFPEDTGGVIVQPNEDAPQGISMTSWGKLQTCKEFRAPVVQAFIRSNCNKGPEKLGLACGG